MSGKQHGPAGPIKKLLVIVGTTENWYNLASGMTLKLPNGTVATVEVEQAIWDDLSCW